MTAWQRACCPAGRYHGVRLTLVWLAVLVLGHVTTHAAGDTATVSLSPLKTRPLTSRPDRKNQTLHERLAGFSFGPVDYAIAYKAAYDPNQPERAFPLEGTIGMPRPASCNWYHGGFLFVLVNGQDIGTAPLSSMVAAESGKRAILDLVWYHAAADVRVRFAGLPEQDYLICEIAIDPKTEVKTLAVKLRCYPSFFTSWRKRVGARRIQTPGGIVMEGERKTFPGEESWWAVFYDDVFDPGRGEGEGPCALLVDPAPMREIRHTPTGYPVETVLSCTPDTRRVRLALWDFRGKDNATALARIRSAADTVREQLETIDLTPEALSTFDAEAARREVAEALSSPSVPSALADKLQDVMKRLDRVNPDAPTHEGPGTVSRQEALLATSAALNRVIWEVRLTALLNDL
ncbi:MAG: hypothetical protein HN742_20275 [Lentisphaerae bacterium]|mgnify:FL=1|jgi:hypothetical protein|nr:hypothetical protein [Lentisphaerota bacterium]MBT4821299.1 hypothetical protein [Lentisphaerota bacterium]MBT5604541.1 hypothetical protein [Lentisphaerota bacterium]MBT7060914.1 hypothetical protein [Lentisphaerota bacterium]MBT7844228.1 hypothetical protein [Lentisphaerota bacterium]